MIDGVWDCFHCRCYFHTHHLPACKFDPTISSFPPLSNILCDHPIVFAANNAIDGSEPCVVYFVGHICTLDFVCLLMDVQLFAFGCRGRRIVRNRHRVDPLLVCRRPIEAPTWRKRQIS